jgi:hypothetical protein
LRLFVLAALFVRAAVLAGLATLILAALLLAAGRLIILRVTSRRLLAAALLVTTSVLSLLSLQFISVVWHFYSSPLLSSKLWAGSE